MISFCVDFVISHFCYVMLVHCGVLSQANNMRRGRGRPKLTWGEAIKRYLKAWDIPRDLCLNMSTWKAAIEVPEP